MRLTRLETSDSLSLSMGITFYRGVGRLLLIPPLWMLLSGKRPSAFVAATRSLGFKRLLVGIFLYMLQNMAFIVSAELTYIASVLAIVATGPLFSAAFSALLLGEKVPRHTWIASLVCAGFVVIIYLDSFAEQRSPRHIQVRDDDDPFTPSPASSKPPSLYVFTDVAFDAFPTGNPRRASGPHRSWFVLGVVQGDTGTRHGPRAVVIRPGRRHLLSCRHSIYRERKT